MIGARPLLPPYAFVAWKGKLHLFRFPVNQTNPSPVLSQIKVAISRAAVNFSMFVLTRVATREPIFMKFGMFLSWLGSGSNSIHCMNIYLLFVIIFFARGKAFGA